MKRNYCKDCKFQIYSRGYYSHSKHCGACPVIKYDSIDGDYVEYSRCNGIRYNFKEPHPESNVNWCKLYKPNRRMRFKLWVSTILNSSRT